MKTFKEYLEENAKSKLFCFDIDETLFKTTAAVHVTDARGKRIKSLTNQEFNDHTLEKGHKYDFSDFRDAKKFHDESKPIHRMVNKIKAIHSNIKRGGHDSKIIMNTAREDFDDKEPVLNKFRKHGIDVDDMHIHRAGNIKGIPTGEKKNVVLRKYLDQGKYKNVHFYDDSHNNLKHFLNLKHEYPEVNFHAYHVDHEGKVKKVK
jgi:hypothetical protein